MIFHLDHLTYALLERGWRAVIAKIGERAGLTKSPDGTWRDPSMSAAA